MDFEKKMKEIEDIVQSLERGELTLDESIKMYAQAMENCNECSKYLAQAKGKIEILSLSTEQNVTEDSSN